MLVPNNHHASLHIHNRSEGASECVEEQGVVVQHSLHAEGPVEQQVGIVEGQPCHHLTVYLQITWYVYARCITLSPVTRNLTLSLPFTYCVCPHALSKQERPRAPLTGSVRWQFPRGRRRTRRRRRRVSVPHLPLLRRGPEGSPPKTSRSRWLLTLAR